MNNYLKGLQSEAFDLRYEPGIELGRLYGNKEFSDSEALKWWGKNKDNVKGRGYGTAFYPTKADELMRRFGVGFGIQVPENEPGFFFLKPHRGNRIYFIVRCLKKWTFRTDFPSSPLGMNVKDMRDIYAQSLAFISLHSLGDWPTTIFWSEILRVRCLFNMVIEHLDRWIDFIDKAPGTERAGTSAASETEHDPQAQAEETAGADDDFESVTWEGLKKQIFNDDELDAEDGVFLGPVIRQSDGHELASQLDSLVSHFRKVWGAFSAIAHKDRDSSEFYKSNKHIECREQVETLFRSWFRVFDCMREAESWFYKTFGPGADNETMDAIAEPLDSLYYGIDAMRSIEWGYLDDEGGAIQEALEELHGLARKIESQSLPADVETGLEANAPGQAHTGRTGSGSKRRGKWPVERTQPAVAQYLSEREKKHKELVADCLEGNAKAIADFKKFFWPSVIAKEIGEGCYTQAVCRTQTYIEKIRPVLNNRPPKGWEPPPCDDSEFGDEMDNMRKQAGGQA